MKVLTVVVNYRTAAMTLDAVRAAVRELSPVQSWHIVVVDNDSGDGSFERMGAAARAEGWGEQVEIMASDHNGGFGFGNNLAIRRALASDDPPQYVYLLNSDAFPDPGSVRTLVEFLDERPEVGIAGSYIHGPDGEPHKTAFRFPTVQSEFEGALGVGLVSRLLERYIVALPIPTEATRVDWLAGASMMIRRQVLETAGLFDEEFFLYYEEVDLCRRAREHGWWTYYVSASSVTHIGSVSTGFKDRSARTPTFLLESRRHYYLKSHGRLYLWATNIAWVAGHSLRMMRSWIQRRAIDDRPKLFQDFVRYNFRPLRPSRAAGERSGGTAQKPPARSKSAGN